MSLVVFSMIYRSLKMEDNEMRKRVEVVIYLYFE